MFDTGCAATLINHKFVKKLKTKKDNTTKRNSKAGSFKTSKKCKIQFKLPALFEHREITWKAYVDDSDDQCTRYDMMIGRDLLQELGMNFLFKERLMVWDNASVPMQDPANFHRQWIDRFEQEIMFVQDPDTIDAERIQSILDAKYAPANLPKVTE